MNAPAGPRATIFDVQRFSLHDGPGIRTVVFFKGCSLRCAWCHNPEGLRGTPEIAWAAGRCGGCLSCAMACPRGAIVAGTVRRIDWSRCDHCGACADVCPTTALRRVGESVGVDDLARRCLADREFYASSEGGVTLSGGEPVLQADFIAAFLHRLRGEGIHTVLETAGSYPFERLAPLLEDLDEIYFDWKFPRPEGYRDAGGDGRRIADNLARLVRDGAALTVRIPVVPGVNDTPEEASVAAATLHEIGVRRVVLLPYNQLWESKLGGLVDAPAPLGRQPQAIAAALVAAFAGCGMAARATWSRAEGV